MYKNISRLKVARIILLAIEFLLGAALFSLSFFADVFKITFEMTPYIFLYFFVFLIIVEITYSFFSFTLIDFSITRNYLNISNIIGYDINEVINKSNIGLLYYSNDYKIMWTSSLFETRNLFLLGDDLPTWLPALQPLFEPSNKDTTLYGINIKNVYYSVTKLEQSNLLIFRDTDELFNSAKDRESQQIVIFYLLVDNYSDVRSALNDTDFAQLESAFRRTVTDYLKVYNMSIFQTSLGRFFGIGAYQDYEQIRKDGFSITNKVKHVKGGLTEHSFTISMGFGIKSYLVSESNELAREALSLAQQRGGDQVGVKAFSRGVEFYGGTNLGIKNTGFLPKIRSFGVQLAEVIRNHSNILIMGHRISDLDSIGASLGVYAFCKNIKSNVKVVYDENSTEIKTNIAIKTIFPKAESNAIFVTPRGALENNLKDTLLILVDFHSYSYALNRDIIDKSKNVIVIDHHRRQDLAIENLLLDFIDPLSSSTGEIVTHMIRQRDYKLSTMTSKIATFLFAGILLDTNHFRSSETSTRTFEACAILKEMDADLDRADDFLRDDYKEFELKTKLMLNVETPHFGIYIIHGNEEDVFEVSVLAKAAQEVLALKEVNSVFAIGRTSQTQVGISARSNNQFNVQLILEKLMLEKTILDKGGTSGGRFSAAGGQINDISVEELKILLCKVLTLYLADAKRKE
ncbi:MAG: DHH family phosphoesterase [Bacillales bacterium]|jgi:c-di-AMP phosphodiesterase-like protein|nr:DHH family phosphoesterase [Bacillales bacterium]